MNIEVFLVVSAVVGACAAVIRAVTSVFTVVLLFRKDEFCRERSETSSGLESGKTFDRQLGRGNAVCEKEDAESEPVGERKQGQVQ